MLSYTPDTSLRVRRRRDQSSVPDLSGEDNFLAKVVVMMMMVDMLTVCDILPYYLKKISSVTMF